LSFCLCVYVLFAQSLTSECESLKMNVEQLQHQVTADETSKMLTREEVEQQLAATVEALESSNQKIVELNTHLASRDEQITELTQVHARNSALDEELNATKAKLVETLNCVDKLNQECAQLKESEINRSSSVDEKVHELQESLDDTRRQLSLAEDEKQSATSQLENVQLLLDSSSEKYSAVTEAHATLQSDFDSMKQSFDQLKQDHSCLSDRTAAVLEECSMLKETVDNLTAQHNSVLAEKQAMCQEVTNLQESLSDSSKQRENTKARENILLRGIVDLNRTLFDQTVSSPIDIASLSLYSDVDVHNLFSTILAIVTGLQNDLESKVKQVQDECWSREVVEREKTALQHEADDMQTSIQSLEEDKKQLSSTVKELEGSQSELIVRCNAYESQVAQLRLELEAAQTRSDDVDAGDETAVCPSATSLQKSVDEKDVEIERLHREIRAYKLDIEQLEQERRTLTEQLSHASVSCVDEERNAESQSHESDGNVDTQPQAFSNDTDENREGDVVSEDPPSEMTSEMLSEVGDGSRDELLEMKGKMAEWEAMMHMLQTERDEIQLELRKLEQQQKRIFSTIDEVLQCILNSMKGRDLFPLNSDAISEDDGSNGELWNKLALLKTVVDELVFEMDEMKEKVHHLTDEVKVSEEEIKNLKEEVEEKSVQFQILGESEHASKERESKLVAEVEHMRSSMSETAQFLEDQAALLEKLKVLSSDVDRLNAEVELLHTEAASKDQLLSNAKVLEETLEQSLEEAKQQLSSSELHLRTVETKYSAEVAELQSERDQLAGMINDLQKDNDTLNQQSADEADDLHRKYSDKCSEVTELNNTVVTYCKEIEELKEQLKVETLEKERMTAEQRKLADALKDLELHLDQLRAETNDLSTAKVALEQQLCTLQEESEQKVKQGESQVSQLEIRLSTFQMDYEKICEQKLAAENELLDRSQKLEQTSTRLNAELESLRIEAASKDQLLSDAKVLEETLEQSLEEARQQLNNSEMHLRTVETKYSAEVAELQSERDQLAGMINDLQKDNDTLHQQSADMTDDLHGKYNDKCSEVTELNNTVITYCKEIEELKEQLKVETLVKEQVTAEQRKLADALRDLELHLDQLRAETNDLSTAKVALEQKLCSLQEESEQKVKQGESQVSQLEIRLSTFQMDYEKICEQKLAAENELLDCSQKLEQTSTRLSQAEEQFSLQTAELLQIRNELERLKEECRMYTDQKSASCITVESVQKSSSSSIEITEDSSTAQV